MDKNQIREVIARRAALELKDGDVVNLGIGLPTMIPDYLPEGVSVVLQSENGLVGMGPTPKPGEENPDFINSGGGYITAVPGAYACSSLASFEIIRGGHVDVTFLGALEVDEHGDLANWIIPGKKVPGMAGAMDLLVGARKVTLPWSIPPKATLKSSGNAVCPLTAAGQVNMIITEMGVMDITDKGIVLREINPEFTVEQVQAATEAQLIIDPDLKPMRQ